VRIGSKPVKIDSKIKTEDKSQPPKTATPIKGAVRRQDNSVVNENVRID